MVTDPRRNRVVLFGGFDPRVFSAYDAASPLPEGHEHRVAQRDAEVCHQHLGDVRAQIGDPVAGLDAGADDYRVDFIEEDGIVTIDADGLDPALCPGVVLPAFGGLGYQEMLDLIEERQIDSVELVGYYQR